MAIDNFIRMFALTDTIDREEGMLAYFRYHTLMCQLSSRYSINLDRVVAVFVSLSPNNDYAGNLRSAVSVLAGIHHGVPKGQVTVSTYKHCRDRAWAYGTGERVFLNETKGPKIINFYHNIINPKDPNWVTIDGHMSAIWQDKKLTMREALIGKREYNRIADALKLLASFKGDILPSQLQAILWFTRKRLFRVKFDPQGDLIDFANSDVWKTSRDVNSILPFPMKGATDEESEAKKQQVETRRKPGRHSPEVQETFANGAGWPNRPRALMKGGRL